MYEYTHQSAKKSSVLVSTAVECRGRNYSNSSLKRHPMRDFEGPRTKSEKRLAKLGPPLVPIAVVSPVVPIATQNGRAAAH